MPDTGAGNASLPSGESVASTRTGLQQEHTFSDQVWTMNSGSHNFPPHATIRRAPLKRGRWTVRKRKTTGQFYLAEGTKEC